MQHRTEEKTNLRFESCRAMAVLGGCLKKAVFLETVSEGLY